MKTQVCAICEKPLNKTTNCVLCLKCELRGIKNKEARYRRGISDTSKGGFKIPGPKAKFIKE